MRAKRTTRDRRVARTDALLHEAIADLVHEKPYDEIAIKEILARANIGRSTFYTHFRDKDELMVSGIHDKLRSTRPDRKDRSRPDAPETILWFALPIFEHIEARQRSGKVPMGVGGRRAMHEQLRRAIVELVEDEMARAHRHDRRPRTTTPPGLVAGWIAATFIQVLDWWVESNEPLAACDANEQFRQLIVSSLSRILS